MEDRDFKGIWIPKEIWLDPNLSLLEKAILAEIDSLDRDDEGCFAGNSHFAEMFGCTERQASSCVSKLIDCGAVEVIRFDGRKRYLRSNMVTVFKADTKYRAEQPHENFQSASRKVPHSNTSSYSENTTYTSYTPYSSCAEPSKDASTPPVYTLPLNDGTLHEITKEDYEKYKRLYPSVDVMGEFRKMEGWFDGHQSKLKTRQGIRRFINTWLSKEQDKGINQRPSVAEKPAAPVDEKPAPPPYTDRSNWWNGMSFQQFMDGRRFFQRDGKWYRLTPDGYTEERGADFVPTCAFVSERTIKYDKPLNPKPVLQD